MIHSETPILVTEGHDSIKTLHLTVTLNGVTTDYDFNATTELILVVKKDADTADVDKMFRYSSLDVSPRVAVLGAENEGNVELRFNKADLPSPGVFRWRLDGVKGGRLEELMSGPFVVKNV